MKWIDAGPVAALGDGQTRSLAVGRRMVAVAHSGGEFFAIEDDTARVNALLSGDIHLAASINPRSMRIFDGKDGFVLSKSTSGNYTNLNIRLDMAPEIGRAHV